MNLDRFIRNYFLGLAIVVLFVGCNQSVKKEAIDKSSNDDWHVKDSAREFEDRAHYPGGIGAMQKFFKDNIIYPSKEWEGVSEQYIQCTVKENGELTDIKIVHGGYDSLMDKEIIRVASIMPKWIPKKDRDGKPVIDSGYIFPIIIEHYKGDPVK
ncbi:MAG TPA: hypothetical protein VK177_03655 [Flavobacteriales bacterium]|nr:hypothetical protein [Flavobacteriales bacterium]